MNEYLNIRQARTFIFMVNNNDKQHCGIYNGALLVVDRSLTPKHGNTVIIEAEGEYGVYQFIRKDNPCYLKKDKVFLLTDQKEVIIKGVVKAIIQPL